MIDARLGLPGFPETHPPDVLRAETEAMSAAWVRVLTARVGSGLRGIYRKGSAQKSWDSRIDYVPEISDVDIHVLFVDDALVESIDDLDAAFEVRAAVLDAYLALVREPLHVPKPQLVIANRLVAPPSPLATVATLWGEPYEDYRPSEEEQAAQRARDREQLRAHDDFLAALPLRVIDRPGPLLERLLHELTWRVSPVAPRVLSVLGMPYLDAWSLNRTSIVGELERRGLGEFARAYAGFYLAGWDVFLRDTGRQDDGGAIAEAVRRGAEVLRLGRELSEQS